MYTVPGIALGRPARHQSRSPRRRAGTRPLLRNGTSRTGAAGAQPACGSGTLHAGDTPRPSGVGPPPIPRFEEASRKMERHPKQLHVRMSDREMESAKGLARELGMTVSDLVRILLQLPAEEVRGGSRLVVVDRTTAARLSREMTRWGHHYNQAVHTLNAIAYYLRANDMEAAEVVEELSRAERKLAEMQPGVESLRRAVAELSGSVLAGLWR